MVDYPGVIAIMMLSKFKKANRNIFKKLFFLNKLTFLGRDNENTFYNSSHLPIYKRNHITLTNTLLAPSDHSKDPTYNSIQWPNKFV